MTTKQSFLEELNIFHNEIRLALGYLYTGNAIQSIITKKKTALSALNYSPLFWNTTLSSLQQSVFITLGRIFELDAKDHSIHKLFNELEANKSLFTKEEFSKRWNEDTERKNSNWLSEYIEKVYVPTDDDFRKFKKFKAQQMAIYVSIYRDLRDHFGHRKFSKNVEIEQVFSKVKIDELEKFCVRLEGIHEAIWQLYHNGMGPLLPLKRSRYSTKNILRTKLKPYHSVATNAQYIISTDSVIKLLIEGKKICLKIRKEIIKITTRKRRYFLFPYSCINLYSFQKYRLLILNTPYAMKYAANTSME